MGLAMSICICLLLCACGQDGRGEEVMPAAGRDANREPPPPPPPPDVGNIGRYDACRATPRRALSDADRCRIAHYASDCTPAADCMVQCLNSAHGVEVGGGCEHVCGVGPHAWRVMPPAPTHCD